MHTRKFNNIFFLVNFYPLTQRILAKNKNEIPGPKK